MGQGIEVPIQQVGNASDVSYINPFIDPSGESGQGFFGGLGDVQNQFLNALFGGGDGTGVAGMLTSGSPTAAINSFLNDGGAEGLSDLVYGSTGSLEDRLLSQAGETSNRAVQHLAGNFANMNALRSGAFADTAGEAVGRIFGDVTNNIAGRTLDLFGGLVGGGLSSATAGQSSLMAGLSSLANLFGQGAGTFGGLQTGLAAPDTFVPDYIEQPLLLDKIYEGLGLGIDAYTAVTSGG